MKATIKALNCIRRDVVSSEAWKMLTYDKELLQDVPKEDVENMVIELSNKLNETIYNLGLVQDHLEFTIKYGGE